MTHCEQSICEVITVVRKRGGLMHGWQREGQFMEGSRTCYRKISRLLILWTDSGSCYLSRTAT